MRGEIIFNKALKAGEDFTVLLKDLCKDKLCLGRIRSKDFEGSIYVLNGRIFAVFFKSSTEELSGVTAFEKLRVLTKDLTTNVIVYSFTKEVLGEVYEKLTKDLETTKVSVVVPSKEVKEKVEEILKPSLTEVKVQTLDQILEKRVLEDATSLGIRLNSLTLAIKEDTALADAVCVDEECSIHDILLILIKNIIENNVKVSKVKLLLHLPKESASSEVTVDNIDLWKVLGYIPYVIHRYKSSIEEYIYTLKKNSLEITITIKIPPELVHPRTIAKELYNQLSKLWKGSLKIKVRMWIPGYGLGYFEGKAP